MHYQFSVQYLNLAKACKEMKREFSCVHCSYGYHYSLQTCKIIPNIYKKKFIEVKSIKMKLRLKLCTN